MKKVTEFTGYISGDYECFCLSKIPFEEWVEKERKRVCKRKVVYPDPDLLYPDDFFPEEAEEKLCKFKITVEVEEVAEK